MTASKQAKKQFYVNSLTNLEFLVLDRLYHSPFALNGWEIYRKVLAKLMHKQEVSTDKKEIRDLVSQSRKNNIDVPHYNKIIRILDDMVEFGWVGKRTEGAGKAKALYYLDQEIRGQIKTFIEDGIKKS